MTSSEDPWSPASKSTIGTLVREIQQHVDQHWRHVLDSGEQDFLRLFGSIGEPAYGSYAQRLFEPVRAQIEQAGFVTTPAFPGTLSTSLEWGPEEQRERWMWCTVRQASGAQGGTIIVRLVHDHTRFRVPRSPTVLTLMEVEPEAIVQEIARLAGRQNIDE